VPIDLAGAVSGLGDLLTTLPRAPLKMTTTLIFCTLLASGLALAGKSGTGATFAKQTGNWLTSIFPARSHYRREQWCQPPNLGKMPASPNFAAGIFLDRPSLWD
jgi:hypothetical protein